MVHMFKISIKIYSSCILWEHFEKKNRNCVMLLKENKNTFNSLNSASFEKKIYEFC